MAVKMPQRNGKNGIKQVVRFGLFWAIIIFVALIFYATLFPASNLKEQTPGVCSPSLNVVSYIVMSSGKFNSVSLL